MQYDDLTQFQARRPLLHHVASSLKTEIKEVLEESGLLVRVEFTVLATEDFASRVSEWDEKSGFPLVDIVDQVQVVAEIHDVQDAAIIQKIIGDHLTVHSTEWKQEQNRSAPLLELVCVVPPQAMPEGWLMRNDVPSMFTFRVKTVDKSAQTQADSVPILYFSDPNAPFPLVMKGGGIKGLAYIGALEELYKRYRFNWFVGTSAGAVTAVLLGAGYTPDELLNIMKAKNFREFFDAPWYQVPVNLLRYHGCYRADTFTDWLDGLLAKKLRSITRVKLSDLPYRVTVYASRRGQPAHRFDSKDADADAAYAARCSMSIPFIFTPQLEQGIRTFDGGIHQNYPVLQLLQTHPNLNFISLYLGPEFYEPVRQSLILRELFSIWTEGTDAEAISRFRSQTVIIDPRPIGTLDFTLSDDEKSYLLACGRAGALSHLNDGSAEHLEAIKVRDELRRMVESDRANMRRWRIVRAIFKVAVAVAVLYFVYCLTFSVACM